MNCRNVFQINQYLENCMTNRASFTMLKKGDMRLGTMPFAYKIVPFFPSGREIMLSKIISLVSDHEKWAEYIKELREWLVCHK